MTEIIARNVNDALAQGLGLLFTQGIPESSRYGDVLVMPDTVITTYQKPRERVLFSPLRNANPFFHLMEALWILDGRNDLAWPLFFNSKFGDFSDDGKTVAGSAYGWRWRNQFEDDQIEEVISELTKNRNSRRAVLQMWDANADLAALRRGTKDVPCNTNAYLDLRHDQLNLTICCRSNDIWWGAYGANAVHFSLLQEYIAARLGAPVGVYRQVSNNFHLYTDIVKRDKWEAIQQDCWKSDAYMLGEVEPRDLTLMPHEFDNDLSVFLNDAASGNGDEWNDQFFPRVAVPMYRAWAAYKDQQPSVALAAQIAAPDWRRACVEWLTRAEMRRAQKAEVQA